MSKLFIVSTPIGNMDDITLRAIKTLGNVGCIACEDTRKTGLLLSKLNIGGKKLISYYEENELSRIPEIIDLIENGIDVALISNAGTPAVSDPGYKLIRACLDKNLSIESIPGPSAIIFSLTSSGLPTDKFIFLGFPPQKSGKRLNFFTKYQGIDCTYIFYESPYRVINSLLDVYAVFGNCDVAVCRELSKIYEEIYRNNILDAIAYFKNKQPRGEFTIVFHPNVNDN